MKFLPEVSLVVSARAAAVPMSLPAIAEVVSSAVFAGGFVADAAPLADVGTVTVRVTVLTDAGSELPADFAGAVKLYKKALDIINPIYIIKHM